MQRFKISLRTVFLLMLVPCVLLAAFRCQILTVSDDLLGAKFASNLIVIDSVPDLIDALKSNNCILVVSHAWSMEDTMIRKELSTDMACGRKLGRFDVFLITPTDPPADNGESDAMHARLDELCGEDGDLPKFHWFHKSAGFIFIKSGDKIEWHPHVQTFKKLKALALNHPPDA